MHGLLLLSSASSDCRWPSAYIDELGFSLLLSLGEAMSKIAAQGGIRKGAGTLYRSALNSGQAGYRARPLNVFHLACVGGLALDSSP